MKRVRRKETNGNNNLQCITRSMKRRGIHENNSVSIIPTDLIIEILTKLPLESIAKLIIVSKLWYSIIRSKYFTELIVSQSLTQPRFLLSINKFLHSSSSSGHHRSVSITPYPAPYCEYFQTIRGLICCQKNTEVMIGNPSTGQISTLPRVKTRRRRISTFFGYDPVNDLYKVLCMTNPGEGGSRMVSEEHQVFTLGDKRKTWRMIKCKHPHIPCKFKGICMNGVVCYLARIKSHELSIISFGLNSEDFNVIKLPEDVQLQKLYNLVNFGGKIALTRYSCNGTLNLWVLEDASKQQWSKVSILVPSWTDLVGNIPFEFRGALSTGELIFSPESAPHPFYILSYDPKEKNAKKVVIEGLGDDFGYALVFLDHVESPMFLPKVR